MSPWLECPTLEFDLDTPVEGRYAHMPAEAIEKGQALLAAIQRELPPKARLLADAIRIRTLNRFHAEACALAKLVKTDWRWVMLANVSYDLALSMLGCSTVALPTLAGPVLARNMDWWPEDVLARTSYLIRAQRGRQLAFAIAGWPGSIGVVSGLSGRGFAVVLNAVTCPDGGDKAGYPVLLHLRRVLEDADSFAVAVEMLSKPRLAAPCLLTVVGTRNEERVVIERSPRKCAQRWPRNGEPLIATNDYRLLFKPQTSDSAEMYRTTCTRFEALSGSFAGHSPKSPVEDTALLYVLTDPAVIQGITAQHVIIRPKTQEIRLFVPRRLVV